VNPERAQKMETAEDIKHRVITVSVNNREVTFSEHQATGTAIKETAIRQGVPIKQDFNLFEVKHDGSLRPIADNETVRLHDKLAFRATAPDDTSEK
jgi:hypothetical protein